ncbi:M24 family metallopeptidase [Calidithermus timidus]|jgi:Xaa-Pro dipeptidase|uniref:M24 family metallopeptidase n=1 Tax=Calidithermus timidus TaxID=307124 RepID=UPI000371D136|nr:aminopeptidase P family protein [Calidithermus timidus]
MNEAALERLRGWMQQRGLERLFVQQPENFAWLTGGDNTVVTLRGVGWLEVCDTLRLHTSQIEAARMAEEETPDLEVVPYPWYTPFTPPGPTDLQHDLTPLRLMLSPGEQERARALGRDTAAALGEAMRSAEGGWSEWELAGAIAEELWARGIQPVVLLVAGEERLFKYRHPLPKDHPLGRLFMGVVCGRRHGLILSATRLRSFGHPEAQALNAQVLQVEAAALGASRPGVTLGQVAQALREAYVHIGRAQEFEKHHQGGVAGYRPREVLAQPGSEVRLETGMLLAYNPSLPGAKVEDTFLLTPTGLENLTPDPEWPTAEFAGRLRPLVMEG